MSEDNVISMTEEATKMKMLDQWLKELVYPGKVSDFIQDIAGSINDKAVERSLCFYTEDYIYYINAIERLYGVDKSYLGCQVNSRKARAGEDWVRGNDLPDGEFNKKTWDRIIYAIVSYELVKLSPFQKPDTLPNMVPEDIA